jgi:hypothetical protein
MEPEDKHCHFKNTVGVIFFSLLFQLYEFPSFFVERNYGSHGKEWPYFCLANSTRKQQACTSCLVGTFVWLPLALSHEKLQSSCGLLQNEFSFPL